MKKLYLLTLLVVLLFAGCNKDELGGGEKPTVPENTEFLSPTHFYGKATFPETKGVAQRDNLWYPGTTIKVKLLNDPLGKAAQIETWAKEWEEFADITFNFVTEGDAHVRIGFDWNANRWVTWSYIGTDCKMVYDQSEATMSFAYWDYASEEEMRGDVLRAFGQVLGLELEHRHLDFDPAWTANIERYWASEINDVPWEILKKYVFDPLDATNTLQTDEYDPESIMIWPFARQYAGNTERYYNYELSDMDKAFVGTLYPKQAADEPLMSFSAPYFDFYMLILEDMVIEWEGHTEHLYAAEAEDRHISGTSSTPVRLYGNKEGLVSLGFDENTPLEWLDISRCGELMYLDVEQESRSLTVDLTGITTLWSLALANVQVTGLDLSKNPLLYWLKLQNTGTSELILTHNSNLENVSCLDNPFLTDREKVIAFAESLPDRTGSPFRGWLYIPAHTKEWVDDICTPKNWSVSYRE